MISRVERPRGGEQRERADVVDGRSERPSAPEGGEPGGFHRVLSKLTRELDRGERLVDRAMSGGHAQLAAGDLIALQAGIYRYTEVVDLSAKLIDRATSAVKTTVGSGGG
jgi:hypothetical protein